MKGVSKMKKIGLATQIFIGLALGIIVGAIFYGNETTMSILQPIGDIFLHLIKMIVIPIVVAALVVSIARELIRGNNLLVTGRFINP